jgi:hypothetical protein
LAGTVAVEDWLTGVGESVEGVMLGVAPPLETGVAATTGDDGAEEEVDAEAVAADVEAEAEAEVLPLIWIAIAAGDIGWAAAQRASRAS